MLRIELYISVFGAYALFAVAIAEHQPCNLRQYSHGFVCVCNETYCDSMDVERPSKIGETLLVSSNKIGQRFETSKGYFGKLSKKPKSLPSVILVKRQTFGIKDKIRRSWFGSITLKINRDKKYQKIEGFGGAFTGAVSYLFDILPESLRHTIYRNYYSKTDGIGYTMMRIPIGGSDFDLEPWAYDERSEEDSNLLNFTKLDDRDLLRISQLRKIEELTDNHEIKIIGATWSPPRWMKTNNAWSGYGYLKPEYYQTWAEYHLQYLRLMAAQNVSYWALSTGNEPLNGVIGWIYIHFMSLGWVPEGQGKFVGENFGPMIQNSEFHDVKLFAGDDQRYTFPWWFDRMLRGSSKAMDYISGLAVHWYWDKFVPATLLDEAHEKYPDKIILNTESCDGDKPFQTHGPELGSWERAEKYSLAIIQDLQHWVGGWIDWNLILNEHGGPSYVNNTVDAAIIVNTTSKSEFYKQPIFYVMGHFSKFILPGSVRIESKLSGFKSGNVKTVAFLCPDDTVAIIFYNHSDKKKIIDFTDDLRGSYQIELQPRSINSFIYA